MQLKLSRSQKLSTQIALKDNFSMSTMTIYVFIAVIFVICLAVLHLWRKGNASSTPTNTNPNFASFQKVYFIAYLTALFADWLQSPYQYKLYSHYGFQEEQIAVLYVCGFASTIVLGSWAPVAADRFGRKKFCIVFTLIYSVASLVKLSSSYFVLLVGRVLGGVATSLLFSSFESWYLHEHVETHDFPKEWIQETFEKADFWNGILAIFAGIVANISAEWLNLGPVSPYIMAVPVLLTVGVLVATRWPENRSTVHIHVKKSCMDGLRDIGQDPKVFLAGIVQSLFESTMYIFVFIWTPVLDKSHAPLGFVFASFMASTVTGAAIFDLLRRRGVSVPTLLASSVVLAAFGNILAAVAARPDDTRYILAYLSFIIIELSVGIYFRAMTIVRTQVVPQATRSAVNIWFRVPLNLIACIILMCLHNDVFRHGNRLIFVSCAALLVLASIGVTCLVSLIRRDEDFGDMVTVNGAKGNGVNSNSEHV